MTSRGKVYRRARVIASEACGLGADIARGLGWLVFCVAAAVVCYVLTLLVAGYDVQMWPLW